MAPIDDFQLCSSEGEPLAEGETVIDKRFEIRATLGAGAMGVVYLAYDRARRIEVALKALRHLDGKALFNFKNEFRSLSHIVHRNLVTLYEFRSAAEQWFFTMELLLGRSFLEHVREIPGVSSSTGPRRGAMPAAMLAAATPYPGRDIDPAQSEVTQTIGAMDEPPHRLESSTFATMESSKSPAHDGSGAATRAASNDARRQAIIDAPLREDALREALAQLAEGVHALHEYGKLHRDLKPSNVLVVPDDAGDGHRVVVCDFGLVTDVHPGSGSVTARRLVGTPAYMSPEQAAGLPLDRASDWHSVGVMLHEALTGRHPFHGPIEEVLEQKRTALPRPCRSWSSSIPGDLADLCDELLRRDPRERPSGEEVLRRLGRDASFIELAAGTNPGSRPFVGRQAELAHLRSALAGVRAGSAAAVFVHGPSGLGKSSLVRHFLGQVSAEQPDAVVLEGRCYERESVPYKSLDSILDALSAMLESTDDGWVAEMIPPDIACLARLFPVLKRVRVIADDDRVVPVDPQELRQRAFGALRALIRRVASRHLTVLTIDDMQWGDADSAAFLRDLIHHPSPPPLLFLGTYRTAEAETSPLLRALLSRSAGDRGELRQVELRPLGADDSRALAETILGTGPGSPEDRKGLVESLTRDTGGNPFFVTELARARMALGQLAAGTSGNDVSLDDLLTQRVSRLPDDARELLTAAAVAGRPTARSLLARVAAVDNELAAVAVLQAEHMLRVRTSEGGDHELETYHDRIRETVTARLTEAARRAYHRRLAEAYEATNLRDPQSLVDHWLGAGDRARAGKYAIQAGQQAADAAAFHHAERYFGLALDLLDLGRERQRGLQVLRGDALAAAGDLLEGAKLHLVAAADAKPERAVELKRRAMMHLLRGGHLGEGLDLARDVLRAVGLSLPRGRRSALASVVYRKLALAVGRRRHKAREREALDDAARLRMDVCWSVQTGVGVVNPLYGAALQLRYVQDARRYDDPYRAAIALGVELGFTGMAGTSERDTVAEISRQAIELAEQSGNPHGRGVAVALSGFAAFLTGQWALGAEGCSRGAQILLNECAGGRYESDIARIYWLASLLFAGRLREMTRAVPPLVREADEIGNVYLGNALRSWRTNLAWLIMDDPSAAREQLAATSEPPMERGEFHLHHFYPWSSEVQIELYEGNASRAWELLHERWRLLQRSMLTRIQSVRIESEFLCGRAAIAVAATGQNRKAMLAEASSRIRRLERETALWAHPMALLLRAGACRINGDREGAASVLAEAAEAFAAADMAGFAAVAQLRRAPLVGGREGQDLERVARRWMESESVEHPDRWAALYAPGLTPERS